MKPILMSEQKYNATRWTIATGETYAAFEARFERAVPQATFVVAQLAACPVSWAEVATITQEAAPHGFLIYLKAPVGRLMRLAGHRQRTTSYLIGNHVVAERMYRLTPGVMLHTPIRNVLWDDADGRAFLSFEDPAAAFSSFEDPDIVAIGREIGHRYAELLTHLELPVPATLNY